MTTPSVAHFVAPRRRVTAVAAAAFVVLTACGSGSTDDATTDADAEPTGAETPVEADASVMTAVVSDPPIADLVSQVAGDLFDVVALVPIGADGHTYQPVPADARALAEADLFIENGMNLNPTVTAFAMANYPEGTTHYALSNAIPADEIIATDSPEEIEEHGHAHDFNAHFWPDPNYAMVYVVRISDILSIEDPANEATYRERAAALNALLEQMDAAFRTALDTIPEANRKLVVYHDSWSYFGRRYDIPVVGAIQPTDFSEPSAAELRSTIEEVRAAGVPAFFGSEVFPSDVLEVIEEESGSNYVADLSDDRLPGDPGSPEHSYVGMMLENVRTIVTELGGDPSALDAVPLVPA